MRLATLLGCTLALLLCPACDDPGFDDAADADVAFRPSTGGGGTGGMYLNTNAIGTNAFSSLDTTGAIHDGVRLVRVELSLSGSFVKLDSVWSDDGELVGKVGTKVYRGASFVGSRWQLGFQKSGLPEEIRTMRVANYAATGTDRRYTFDYTAADGTPTPMCADADDGAVAAVVLGDVAVDAITGDVSERANTLYLGCVSGAVGKAVTWGYLPWELGADDFEAAVRVVRADYCGDGSSWTQPGTSVQLDDVWAINTFANNSLPTEAVWGEQGALCIANPRVGLFSAGSITCNGQALPVCTPGANLYTLPGSLFWTRTAAQ